MLELGGSDPFIVLADADLEHAARTAARARNQNNGQSCIAAKRFIVEESVADEFGALFADAVRALRVGDPASRETNVGPLARERPARHARTPGRRVAAHGRRAARRRRPRERDAATSTRPPSSTASPRPCPPSARRPSVRWPRCSARATSTHAIGLANDSEYGLGAAVWTRDLDAAKGIARRIEAGTVFVNGIVASDPRMPIGGVKRSGYGRELGRHGIWEFTNIQTVRIGPADPA